MSPIDLLWLFSTDVPMPSFDLVQPCRRTSKRRPWVARIAQPHGRPEGGGRRPGNDGGDR